MYYLKIQQQLDITLPPIPNHAFFVVHNFPSDKMWLKS